MLEQAWAVYIIYIDKHCIDVVVFCSATDIKKHSVIFTCVGKTFINNNYTDNGISMT